MGLDLTGANGREGRIAVMLQQTAVAAVEKYWQGDEYPPVLWPEWGEQLDEEQCNLIAAALNRALDDGFFGNELRAQAQRLVAFLRNCGGSFTAV